MLYQTHVCSIQTRKRTDRKAEDTNTLHPTLFTSQEYSSSRECHKDISFFGQLQKVEGRKNQARVHPSQPQRNALITSCKHLLSIEQTMSTKAAEDVGIFRKEGVKEVRPGLIEPDDYVTSKEQKT